MVKLVKLTITSKIRCLSICSLEKEVSKPIEDDFLFYFISMYVQKSIFLVLLYIF